MEQTVNYFHLYWEFIFECYANDYIKLLVRSLIIVQIAIKIQYVQRSQSLICFTLKKGPKKKKERTLTTS